MKKYKCTYCFTSFEAEYKEDCPNCGDDIDIIEVSAHTDILSVEKLQEQLNTAKKNIEHAIGTIKHDGHLGTIQTDWILPDLEKALAAIGGDDDENRL